MTILIVYLSLICMFAHFCYVNILLFHWVHFTSFSHHYIEQIFVFIHLVAATARSSTK